MDIKNNLDLAYDIAKYIRKCVCDNQYTNLCGNSHFKDGPNPYYNQITNNGIWLEEYYGTPSKLYTQIGVWTILGSTSSSNNGFKQVMDKLRIDLGLKIIQEGKETQMGYFGPIWQITTFNNKNLPIGEKRHREDYISYNICKVERDKFKKNKEF